MNHRLLTRLEKRQNARGRWRRNNHQKWRRHRDQLIESVAAHAETAIDLEWVITPEESLVLLTAHLHCAKRVALRLSRRLLCCRTGTAESGELRVDDAPEAPVPARVLQVKNRALVFPWLIPERCSDSGYNSFSDVLGRVRAAKMCGADQYALVDLLAQTAGVSEETSMSILEKAEFIAANFGTERMEAVKNGRAFWNQWADARFRFATIFSQSKTLADGDWGFCERRELEVMLPGVHIPKALLRPEYLIKLARHLAGLPMELHVFSINRLPLFAHPFY